MAEGDIGAVIDSLEFDAVGVQYPKLVHVAGDIYAIAYRGADGDGWLATVDIDASGNIGAAVVDSFEFDAVAGVDVDIIQVAVGMYAIVYRNSVNDGWLVTIDIDASGNIGAAVVDSLEFDAGAGYSPRLIHVGGNVFAIVYRNASVYGQVITVSIYANGTVSGAIIDTLNFDTTRGISPHIVHVAGDIYAIAYQGVDDDGWLVTIDIDASGNIGAAVIDSFEFDGASAEQASIIQVAVGMYAIAYKGVDGDGWLATIDIDASGNIGAAVIDSFEFDAFDGLNPCLIHVSGDVYAIAYEGNTADGWLATVSIDASGNIGAAVIDSLEFDVTEGVGCCIVHVTGNIYAIAYHTTAGPGLIKTVDIETAAPAAMVQHLMMMGIG